MNCAGFRLRLLFDRRELRLRGWCLYLEILKVHRSSRLQMKVHRVQTLSALLFGLASLCLAQAGPIPQERDGRCPTGIQDARHRDVGRNPQQKQEYEWLDSLVANPEFADQVDDVVMEFGNSLYQKSVDRYIAGEAVPIEDVQRAWRNVLGLGPPPRFTENCIRRSAKRTCAAVASIRCVFFVETPTSIGAR